MHYGHPKDEGLAANINDSMDAGGMAAASVQGAARQLTRGQLTRRVVQRCAEERATAEADPKSKHKNQPHLTWTGAGNA